MKHLSITADDFGAHPIIDKGILQAFDKGSIDNIDSLVTVENDQYSSSSVLKKLYTDYSSEIDGGNLAIGLHLSLTCGRAASNKNEVKDLFCYDNGGFKLIPKHKFSRINKEKYRDVIRTEFEAQLQNFTAATGHLPSHVSCHSGMGHLNKNLSTAYFEFCTENKLPVRNPFLISRINKSNYPPNAPTDDYTEKTIMTRVAYQNGIKMLLSPPILNELNLLLYSKGKKLFNLLYHFQNLGLKTTDYFIDNFYCSANEENLDYLLSNLYKAKSEMVVHPIADEPIADEHPIPKGIDVGHIPYRIDEYKTITDQPGLIDSKLAAFHGNEWSRFRMRAEDLV
jgi:predicted glycoside hydrolase/deacetylase ChbG (UPF0249 family)